MRTHRQIVKAYGASALQRALKENGVSLALSTPQRWAERDSIPGEYWQPIADLGAATLEELSAAAAARKATPAPEQRSAA